MKVEVYLTNGRPLGLAINAHGASSEQFQVLLEEMGRACLSRSHVLGKEHTEVCKALARIGAELQLLATPERK